MNPTNELGSGGPQKEREIFAANRAGSQAGGTSHVGGSYFLAALAAGGLFHDEQRGNKHEARVYKVVRHVTHTQQTRGNSAPHNTCFRYAYYRYSTSTLVFKCQF